MRSILVVFLLLFPFFGNALASEDVWKGHVYKDKSNLALSLHIGDYPTFDDCRNTALVILRWADLLESGSFECGLNCRYKEEWDVQICKQTIQWNLNEGFDYE